MKRKLFKITVALAVIMSLVSGGALALDTTSTAIDNDIFEKIRFDMIEDELQSYGILEKEHTIDQIIVKNEMTRATLKPEQKLDFVENIVIASDSLNMQEKNQLMDKIEDLSKAKVVYIDTDTRKVYDSENGFVGYTLSAKEQNFIQDDGYVVNLDELNEEGVPKDRFQVVPMSQSNPTSKECFGGSTGAFERRQLGYGGFDKITSNFTLPTITIPSDPNGTKKIGSEQSWVYYGFDSASGKAVEGGFAHQTGSSKWLPFIRVGSQFYYGSTAKYDGNTINDFNMVLKKASTSDTYYTAYLYIGSTQTLTAFKTNFTSSDINTMSVKRMTTIAKDGFDSTSTTPAKAIYTQSKNQKFDSVNVRRYYSTSYSPWSSYSEYKKWENNMWYGTVDCTSSYVKRSGSYVSIYK